jgi:hypothetical protein
MLSTASVIIEAVSAVSQRSINLVYTCSGARDLGSGTSVIEICPFGAKYQSSLRVATKVFQSFLFGVEITLLDVI